MGWKDTATLEGLKISERDVFYVTRVC